MPYAIRGNSVVKKNSGKIVGHSKNPKKYMKVLNMVEHGIMPKVLGKMKGIRGA